VLGAFDDLNGIADLCEKYELWLHADACLGGSAVFSKKHRHLLNGDLFAKLSLLKGMAAFVDTLSN
jgi:glutamate/tyrosine decarboxylase-like PLP-dependent enzyme